MVLKCAIVLHVSPGMSPVRDRVGVHDICCQCWIITQVVGVSNHVDIKWRESDIMSFLCLLWLYQHIQCNNMHCVLLWPSILYLCSVCESLTMKSESGCCSLSLVHVVFLLVALVNWWVSDTNHLCKVCINHELCCILNFPLQGAMDLKSFALRGLGGNLGYLAVTPGMCVQTNGLNGPAVIIFICSL